jgi:hypothetical protein
VTSAPQTEHPTSTPAKTGSNSTHFAIVNAATTSLISASSTPATLKSAVVNVVETVKQPSAAVTEASVVATTRAFTVKAASSALATEAVAAATALVAPAAQVAAPATGPVGFLNGIVTNLLNPFLAPAPSTPEPSP